MSDLFFFFFRKNSNKDSDLSEEDIHTVRASLYGLVKYYISKGMSQPEMLSILGYIAAIADEDQVRINKKWSLGYLTHFVVRPQKTF